MYKTFMRHDTNCAVQNASQNKIQSNTVTTSANGTEHFVQLKTSVVINEEYNIMVNSEEYWYHRISDVICEVSHKPMPLKPGYGVRFKAISYMRCWFANKSS
jgi:dsDNA-specific endonuclease/ATPase MutS2